MEEERRAKPKEPRARAASVGARVNPKGILKPKMDEDPFGWIGTTEYLPLPNSPPTRATSRTQPLRPRAKLAAKSKEFEERPLDEQLEALEGSDYGDHCPEYYEAIPEFGVAESLGFHDDRWTPEQWLAWQKRTWTETQAECGEDTLYDYVQEERDHPDDEEPPDDKEGNEYDDEEYYEEEEEPDLPKDKQKRKRSILVMMMVTEMIPQVMMTTAQNRRMRMTTASQRRYQERRSLNGVRSCCEHKRSSRMIRRRVKKSLSARNGYE